MLTSEWLDTLRRDLKFTRRVLTKHRALTATAIVTLALGIMSIPAFARIARSQALPLLGQEFVLAARAAGAGTGPRRA